MPHDHGLLWVQNALTFGVSKNEKIECFVNKYLTIDEIMLPIADKNDVIVLWSTFVTWSCLSHNHCFYKKD